MQDFVKDGGVLFEQSPKDTLGAVASPALRLPPRRVLYIIFIGDDLHD